VEAVESRALAILADVDHVDLEAERDPPVPLVRLPLPHRERLAAALGVADYLTKPVTRAEVLAAVDRLGRPIRRALIVDDDPRFVRLIAGYLRRRAAEPDAELIAAHNGRDALAAMESARPDVVLLDLSMPELGGAELLAAMAERPGLADVPVILISAWDQGEGLLLQGPLTVAKPDGFRLEEMLGSIETLLSTLDPPHRYLGEGSAASPRKVASKRA
jgi:CheY-like chemotaxis protein